MRWTKDGLKVEADPRHVEIHIKEMGLAEADAVVTPGAKAREGKGEQQEQILDRTEGARFRACVARANYLS